MNLQFDFGKKRGKIKPMHAVGQPPTSAGEDGIYAELCRYLQMFKQACKVYQLTDQNRYTKAGEENGGNVNGSYRRC